MFTEPAKRASIANSGARIEGAVQRIVIRAKEIPADLLQAEVAYRYAASVRYHMSAAKLPVVKDIDVFVFGDTPINEGLVRSLRAGSFLLGKRNIPLVGGPGTGKTHLAVAITASVLRAGARGRSFNTVDRPMPAMTDAGKQRSADGCLRLCCRPQGRATESTSR